MSGLYVVVGFIVVWGVLVSLLITGAASVMRSCRSLIPDQQLIAETRVDLELRKARDRMITETARQKKGT